MAFWVNGLRHLLNLYLEPALNYVKDLLVFIRLDEGDGKATVSKPSGSSHSVQVGVSCNFLRGELWVLVCPFCVREIVVEHNVHLLHVDTTSTYVSGDHNALVKPLLEVLE